MIISTAPLKRNIFSAEAGGKRLIRKKEPDLTATTVQTDESEITEALRPDSVEEVADVVVRASEDSASMLTAADLSDILKWSQVISSDINLVSCKCTKWVVGRDHRCLIQLCND